MNTTQQTARVGLFFLFGLALVWVTYETLSGGKPFSKEGYTLVAGFNNLQDLKAGRLIGALCQSRESAAAIDLTAPAAHR